jgi:hypothetical protein
MNENRSTNYFALFNLLFAVVGEPHAVNTNAELDATNYLFCCNYIMPTTPIRLGCHENGRQCYCGDRMT